MLSSWFLQCCHRVVVLAGRGGGAVAVATARMLGHARVVFASFASVTGWNAAMEEKWHR